MSHSILRNLLIAFLGFGLSMGIVFPFFAEFFVEFKPGMYGWFFAGCLVAGAIIGLINYGLLRWLLITRLEQIARISTAISEHDLSFTCKIKSNDVVGEIIDSFNTMAATLRNVVGELKSGSEQMLRGVDSICVTAEATQSGVGRQHEETRKVENAITNMTHTVQHVSARASEAADAADQARSEAINGQQVVKQTVAAIQSLAQDVENAAQSINRLEAESTNIGTVLDVIRSISEQTNLLALNAAIEAARAGDQGRGFAVVADEVRTLALRTQASTQEIQTMIETLQTVSRDTVGVMDKSQTQARLSVDQAAKAGESLDAITRSVEAITDINRQIDQESSSQTSDAENINQTMHNISQIAEDSKAGSEKTTAESQSLANLAARLQQLVGDFKL